MKKLIYVLLACLLIIVCGCTDSKADISNRDEVVISIDGKVKYTKGQFYDALISNDVESLVLNKLVNMIFENKVDPTSVDLDSKAQEFVDNLKNLYGEDFEQYLQLMGYESVEDYKEDMMSSLKLDAICDHYIEVNLESLIKKSHTCKVRIIDIADLEEAKQALDKLKELASLDKPYNLEDLATAHNSVEYKGNEIIIFEGYTDLPTCIEVLLKDAKIGLVDEVITNDKNNGYYIVEFTDIDANNFKDELNQTWLDNGLLKAVEIIGNYAKEGNFRIYDESIDKILREYYPEFFE